MFRSPLFVLALVASTSVALPAQTPVPNVYF